MHAVLNRDYLDHLPDPNLLDDYRKLILKVPDAKSDIIGLHLENALLEFYCKCGCHSFYVLPRNRATLPKLRDHNCVYKEIAYKTNYPEDLNVMLIIDEYGILCQVTVFFGRDNLKVIPNNLIIGSIEGIW